MYDNSASSAITDVSKLNTDEAINFLRWLDPTGWHNLVAIHPDAKTSSGGARIEGKTFGPNNWDAMRRWIDARNGNWNLYFSVNEPCANAPDEKLSHAEISSVRAFFADFDVKLPPGAVRDAERKDLAMRLEYEPLVAEIYASAVVDSGNGYWAFWKLDEKRPVTADYEAALRSLAQHVDSDQQCVDVGRIARLPGTANLPNASKRARGLVSQAASVVSKDDEDAECPYDEFVSALPVINARPSSERTSQTPLIEWDLPESVSSATAYLIKYAPEAIEGSNGDGTTFEVAAKMKDFGISEHLAFDLLLEHWNPDKAIPSWDPAELRDKVRNAYAYGTALPGKDSRAMAEREFTDESVNIACLAPTDDLGISRVVPFEGKDLPARRWILGKYLARGFASALVSPPGTGKTTFLAAAAIAIVAGRDDVVAMQVHERTRVLIWNQEDDEDELKRRIAATMSAFGITWDTLNIDGEIGLFLGSGVRRALQMAKRSGTGGIVAAKDVPLIQKYCAANKIGVVIFDPFVELHPAEENNNTEMAAVARIFREVAVKGDLSSVIVHHTRKPGNADAASHAGNMDTARGGGSVAGVVRTAATLFNLDTKTGAKYGLTEEETRQYVRFDYAKNNLAFNAAGDPLFLKREGVLLDGIGSEEVGALRPLKLTKRPSSQAAARDALVADVAALVGDGEIGAAEVARTLCREPFYSDEKEDSLCRRVKRAFEEPVEVSSGEWIACEKRKVAGQPGQPVMLFKTKADIS